MLLHEALEQAELRTCEIGRPVFVFNTVLGHPGAWVYPNGDVYTTGEDGENLIAKFFFQDVLSEDWSVEW